MIANRSVPASSVIPVLAYADVAEAIDWVCNAVTHSVHVRVEDAERHHEQAVRWGARILRPPTDYPYGERQ